MDNNFAEKQKNTRLLLHSCCAPCSTYALEYLTGANAEYPTGANAEYPAADYDITVFFYNPNIMPAEEFDKRLFWQKHLINQINFGLLASRPLDKKIKMLAPEYAPERFLRVSAGYEREPEGGARCELCFRLRLEETARVAKTLGFDKFCTTLTVSPHKNAALINALGRELEEKYGVSWLFADFKKRGGYQRSIALSKEYGLYRQNYCGCVFAKNVVE